MYQTESFYDAVLHYLFKTIRLAPKTHFKNLIKLIQKAKILEIQFPKTSDNLGESFELSLSYLSDLFVVVFEIYDEANAKLNNRTEKLHATETLSRLCDYCKKMLNTIFQVILCLEHPPKIENESLLALKQLLTHYVAKAYPHVNEQNKPTHRWSELRMMAWVKAVNDKKPPQEQKVLLQIFELPENLRRVFFSICSFNEFDLSQYQLNELTGDEWLNFLDFLFETPVKQLNLSGNCLKFWNEFEWDELFTFISQKKVEVLDLSYNEFGLIISDLKKVIFRESKNIKLKKLVFSGNNLDQFNEEDWEVFFDFISRVELEILDLSHNGLSVLSEENLLLFFMKLKKTNIKFLNLSRNGLQHMPDNLWEVFCDGLMKLEILKLDISKNDFPPDKEEQLRGILGSNFFNPSHISKCMQNRNVFKLTDLCFFSIFKDYGSEAKGKITNINIAALKDARDEFLKSYGLII